MIVSSRARPDSLTTRVGRHSSFDHGSRLKVSSLRSVISHSEAKLLISLDSLKATSEGFSIQSHIVAMIKNENGNGPLEVREVTRHRLSLPIGFFRALSGRIVSRVRLTFFDPFFLPQRTSHLDQQFAHSARERERELAMFDPSLRNTSESVQASLRDLLSITGIASSVHRHLSHHHLHREERERAIHRREKALEY